MSVARLAPGLFLATAAMAWLAAGCGRGSDRPTLNAVQKTLNADAAKGRFTGPLGNFIVFSRTDSTPHNAVDCPSGDLKFVSDTAALRRSELWENVFGLAASGVSCDGKAVVVNNGSDPMPDGTGGIVKMYFAALPAPVSFDAPKDRIEITNIAGFDATVEHALPGYPYASVGLAVIQRPPAQDQPGIVAYVNFSPSEDIAVALAKRLLQ